MLTSRFIFKSDVISNYDEFYRILWKNDLSMTVIYFGDKSIKYCIYDFFKVFTGKVCFYKIYNVSVALYEVVCIFTFG